MRWLYYLEPKSIPIIAASVLWGIISTHIHERINLEVPGSVSLLINSDLSVVVLAIQYKGADMFTQ